MRSVVLGLRQPEGALEDSSRLKQLLHKKAQGRAIRRVPPDERRERVGSNKCDKTGLLLHSLVPPSFNSSIHHHDQRPPRPS